MQLLGLFLAIVAAASAAPQMFFVVPHSFVLARNQSGTNQDKLVPIVVPIPSENKGGDSLKTKGAVPSNKASSPPPTVMSDEDFKKLQKVLTESLHGHIKFMNEAGQVTGQLPITGIKTKPIEQEIASGAKENISVNPETVPDLKNEINIAENLIEKPTKIVESESKPVTKDTNTNDPSLEGKNDGVSIFDQIIEAAKISTKAPVFEEASTSEAEQVTEIKIDEVNQQNIFLSEPKTEETADINTVVGEQDTEPVISADTTSTPDISKQEVKITEQSKITTSQFSGNGNAPDQAPLKNKVIKNVTEEAISFENVTTPLKVAEEPTIPSENPSFDEILRETLAQEGKVIKEDPTLVNEEDNKTKVTENVLVTISSKTDSAISSTNEKIPDESTAKEGQKLSKSLTLEGVEQDAFVENQETEVDHEVKNETTQAEDNGVSHIPIPALGDKSDTKVTEETVDTSLVSDLSKNDQSDTSSDTPEVSLTETKPAEPKVVDEIPKGIMTNEEIDILQITKNTESAAQQLEVNGKENSDTKLKIEKIQQIKQESITEEGKKLIGEIEENTKIENPESNLPSKKESVIQMPLNIHTSSDAAVLQGTQNLNSETLVQEKDVADVPESRITETEENVITENELSIQTPKEISVSKDTTKESPVTTAATKVTNENESVDTKNNTNIIPNEKEAIDNISNADKNETTSVKNLEESKKLVLTAPIQEKHTNVSDKIDNSRFIGTFSIPKVKLTHPIQIENATVSMTDANNLNNSQDPSKAQTESSVITSQNDNEPQEGTETTISHIKEQTETLPITDVSINKEDIQHQQVDIDTRTETLLKDESSVNSSPKEEEIHAEESSVLSVDHDKKEQASEHSVPSPSIIMDVPITPELLPLETPVLTSENNLKSPILSDTNLKSIESTVGQPIISISQPTVIKKEDKVHSTTQNTAKLSETEQTTTDAGRGKSLSQSTSTGKASRMIPVANHFGFSSPSLVVMTKPKTVMHEGVPVDPRTLVAPQFRSFFYDNDSPEVTAAKIAFFRVQGQLTSLTG